MFVSVMGVPDRCPNMETMTGRTLYYYYITSIFNCLSGVGLWGQQFQMGTSNYPLMSNISNFLLADLEAYPGQFEDVITPSGPWSTPESLLSGTCSEEPPR